MSKQMKRRLLWISMTLICLVIIATSLKVAFSGTAGSLELIETFGNDGYVLKGEKPYVASSDYVGIEDYNFHKGRSRYSSKKDISWNDYSKVHIYKLNEYKKKYKTLDLLSIIQKENDNYLPSGKVNSIVKSRNGQAYLQIPVYYMPANGPAGANFSLHTSFVNIETEEVLIDKKEHSFKEEALPDNMTYDINYNEMLYHSDVTNIGDKLLQNLSSKNNSSSYVFDKKTDLSKTVLAQKYPKAVKLLEEGNELYWKSGDKKLAELLAQEGETDVFEGVTLYGEYSKDGQDHVVQSYDELMEWYHMPEDTEEKEDNE